ncbi:hypothetical protein ICNINCKA_01831 [Synechococcus sp. CBW1107]|nr:hypothetical protein ICNINCKA_01831 [Synechococcus sp. CBW1107]
MVSLEMLGYTSETQDYHLPTMRDVYGYRGDFIALVGKAATALPLL